MSDTSRALAAAITMVAAVGIGLSLSVPLLSIELERMGVSGSATGLTIAVSGLAAIAAAPAVPTLARRLGIGTLIVIAIALAALTLIAFKVTMNFWAWIPLRILFAISLVTLFIVSEFWIAHAAPPERRGIIMGIYATALSVGFVAGPTLLAFVGTTGWVPYLAGVGLFLLAGVPLILARSLLPELAKRPSKSVRHYLFVAPLAAAAGLASGAVETGAIGMLPIFGLRIGMEPTTATLLVSAVAIGNVITQIPVGWLSDRVDRRALLLAVAVVVILLSCALALAASAPPALLFTVLMGWGGFTGAFYTLGLAHLASRFSASDLVGANAAFIIMFNAGQLTGPPLIGAGLDHSVRYGFPAATGIFALIVVAMALRERARKGP